MNKLFPIIMILLLVVFHNPPVLTSGETLYMSPENLAILENLGPGIFDYLKNKEGGQLAHYPSGKPLPQEIEIKPEPTPKQIEKKAKKKKRTLALFGGGLMIFHSMAESALQSYKSARNGENARDEFQRLEKTEKIRNALLGALMVVSQVKF